MISAEIIRSPTDLSRYSNDWGRLFVGGVHEPSTSFEWTQALFQNHVRDNDGLFLIVLKRGERIEGLIPISASGRKVLGVPLVNISPLAELYNTHSDFLVASLDQSHIRPIVEALFCLPYAWDTFWIKRLLEGSALSDSLETVLRERGASFRVRVEAPSFVLALPQSFETYMAARTQKFRNFLRRAEKKFAGLGKVAMIRAGKEMGIEAAFSALVEIETKSWKHQHGTAISAIDHQLRFYRSICRSMAKAGRLHLTFLTLNGNPVAYNLGLSGGTTYYYLKTSFDDHFRTQSPATILRARLIDSLILEGMKIFDFPGEPYEWEAQWTQELRWHRSVLLYNTTRRARFFAFLEKLHSLKRRNASEKKLVFQDPLQLKPPRKR